MRLSELAIFRQAAYQLFAGVLLYPEGERLRVLREAAGRLERQSRPHARFAFFPQWSRFLRTLGSCHDGDRVPLEEAYTRLFLASPEGVIPPYASHYLDPASPAQVMAEIERQYRRAGLSPDPRLNEPPDHAAVELEFLSVLCGEEAQTWRDRGVQAATEKLRGEARFLTEYLCPWFPEFARRVTAREKGGFYSVATDAVSAFVQHDRELLLILLDRYRNEVEDAA